MREEEYQKWLNEETQNGNSRLDNILICLGGSDKQCRHVATQLDMAFQAGWSARSKIITDKASLHDLVENYLTRSGIGESYFGVAACGNSNFVKRMRGGGRFFPETEAKVRAFIAKNPA